MQIFHKDHGITQAQWDYILARLEVECLGVIGFFIHQIFMPIDLGTVPCAIYGPIMGDSPILDSEVFMKQRSADRPPDRMINKPMRREYYVQVIGIWSDKDEDRKIFTCYGGPLAPQNPLDPNLVPEAKRDSEAFWAQHALSTEML